MEANPVDTEYARGFHWGSGKSKVEEFGEADCPECGKHFIKKAWNQRFCTVACRNKADLARWKQRTVKRREQRKAQPEWVACPGLDCQNIFLKKPQHRKYCSQKCKRHTVYYLRQRKTPSFKTCDRCERTFVPKRHDSIHCHECARAECGVCGAEYVKKTPDHKYCSKKCSNKSRYARRPATRSCVVCGTEFTPVSIRHKTCSPKCGNTHQARRKRERNRQ